MSDREKVQWLRALLVIWGSIWPLLILVANGAPVPVGDPQGAACGALAVFGMFTALYLLILSWRAAYLSGKNK